MSSARYESLCYLIDPTRVSQFFEFFKNGRKVNGEWDEDEMGRKTIGVLSWLVGTHQCENVHFFSTGNPVPAVVVTLPLRRIPWLDIGGFMDFVVKGTTTLELKDGQFQLDQRSDLEDALAVRCAAFNSNLEVLSDGQRKKLEDALIGLPKTNLDAVVKEIEASTAGRIGKLLDPL